MSAWRDEFVDGGIAGLEGKGTTTEYDLRLRDGERKIGELRGEKLEDLP